MANGTPDWKVEIDATGVLSQYRTDIGATLTSFRSAMHVVNSGDFGKHAETDPSDRFMTFSLTGIGQEYVEQIRAPFISSSFRSLIASTIQFMDKLIGIRKLFQDFVVGDDVEHYSDLNEYLEHRVKLATANVGRDRKFSARQKVEEFDRLSTFSKDSLLDYIEIRNVLEHRHGIADRDIVLRWDEILPTINGEIAPEGTAFQPGDALGLPIVEFDRAIPAGDSCAVIEDEVHKVHGSLSRRIGPELFSHLFPHATGP
jgi:hypothetical protein